LIPLARPPSGDQPPDGHPVWLSTLSYDQRSPAGGAEAGRSGSTASGTGGRYPKAPDRLVNGMRQGKAMVYSTDKANLKALASALPGLMPK